MSCVHAVCEYFNYKGGEVFEMSAVDFLVYLNYINAERREQDRRQRAELAKIKSKH